MCDKLEAMKDIEKKRRKEQYVVGEMIRLYCRKKHKESDRKKGNCVRTVRNFLIMPDSAVKNVRLWRISLSAVTAGSTATNRKCARRSGR